MTIKSILPKVLQGVVFITGPFGVGKSTLAASAENPANVIYIDFDDKGEILDSQLHFHSFYPMGKMASEEYGLEFTQLQMFELIQKTINKLEPGPTTVIIDNVSPLEQAFAAEVMRDPGRYGVNKANAEAGRYGGPQPGVKLLITRLNNSLKSKGYQAIIATSHVGGVWEGGQQVPNKWNAKGSGMWDQLAILKVALIPSTKTVEPDGLVLKEGFGFKRWDDDAGEVVASRLLPLKIPAVSFKEIRNLIENPLDMKKLDKKYLPNKEEQALYSKELSDVQRAHIALMAQAELAGLANKDEEGKVIQPTPNKKPEAVAATGEIKNGDWATYWSLADKAGRKAELQATKAGKSFADMAAELGLKVI